MHFVSSVGSQCYIHVNIKFSNLEHEFEVMQLAPTLHLTECTRPGIYINDIGVAHTKCGRVPKLH